MVICACASSFAYAQGEIYRCPDPAGRPTYTNVKRDTVGKNCTMVTREVSVVPATPVSRSLIPAKATAVLSRDESRRMILENELESEQRLLSDAKQKLAQEGGKSHQDSVELHLKNIEQLQHELGLFR